MMSNMIYKLIKKNFTYGLLVVLLHSLSVHSAVEFSTDDAGQVTNLELWGIGWIGNTSRSITHMGGEQNIDIVRIGCPNEWPLSANNRLSDEAIAEIDKQIAKAVRVQQGNASVRWALVCSGGKSINAWYVQSNGKDIRGARWLEMFRAVKNYVETNYGMQLAFYEVGNEQDFNKKIGTPSNIHGVQQRFKADPDFSELPAVGPSTLSSGNAKNEYDVIKNSTDWGATHLINGSGQKYLDFVKQVIADGKIYWGSEIHHLVEMIIAEEYGAIGGSWWNTVSDVRGKFVQFSSGNRICYKEKIESTSAASCYRGENNDIHIFAASGGNNDGGATFEFVATDRPVYWNGRGPLNRFTVTIDNTEERYIHVTLDPPNSAPSPLPSPSVIPTPSVTPTPISTPTPPKAGVPFEAESGVLFGSAATYEDELASGGQGVAFINELGAGIGITNVPASGSLTVNYASMDSGRISMRVNGEDVGNIDFNSTGAWVGSYANATVDLVIPQNATFELFFDTGDAAMNVDYLKFNRASSATPRPTPSIAPTPIITPTLVAVPTGGATPFPAVDWYFIVHKPTGFKIQSCAEEDGEPVTSRANTNAGDCVQWKRISNGDYFYLQNRYSEKYIKPDTSEDGSPISAQPNTWRGNWTQWRLDDRGDGFGHIVNRGTSKYIFLSAKPNSNIQQQPSSWRGEFTRWRFEPIPAIESCPEGYTLSGLGLCETVRGCVFPDIDIERVGGVPLPDGTANISFNCGKNCNDGINNGGIMTGPSSCQIFLP